MKESYTARATHANHKAGADVCARVASCVRIRCIGQRRTNRTSTWRASTMRGAVARTMSTSA